MIKRRIRATAAGASRPDPNALVLHEAVLALEPEVLHAQAEASVRALLKEGESANTVRSYAGALRYWAAWFRLRYRRDFGVPLPVPVVLQFLVDHVERTSKEGTLTHDLPPAIDATLVEGGFKGALGAPALNTVLHRLSVLSKAHQVRDLPNPARDPGFRSSYDGSGAPIPRAASGRPAKWLSPRIHWRRCWPRAPMSCPCRDRQEPVSGG
jgi:hypothetical protein